MVFGVSVQEAIFKWYQLYGRHDLPWRKTSDAYEIYISEIMLQQTQVKTVLERFYGPFLERFPTLKSIQEAPLDDVLKMWEGLGYYTRAKNIHHTALTCKGILPQNAEALEALKGIGKSTAHAICAFAHHQALPILDANIKRVLCRFCALEVKDEKILWQKAWELLNRHHPYEHNQALMDLGALVCTSKNPDCQHCPLHVECMGKEDYERYPLKVALKKSPLKKRYALVILRNQSLGLIQRKERLLHGLWGFIQSDCFPEDGRIIGAVQHTYSHFKLHLNVLITQEEHPVEGWFSAHNIHSIALSSVDLKILTLLKEHSLFE